MHFLRILTQENAVSGAGSTLKVQWYKKAWYKPRTVRWKSFLQTWFRTSQSLGETRGRRHGMLDASVPALAAAGDL